MTDKYENFAHLIEADEKNRCIVIHRVFNDGTKDLLTRFRLPQNTAYEDKKGFHEFARHMAMYIFCDSSVVRELMEFEKMDNVVDPIYD